MDDKWDDQVPDDFSGGDLKYLQSYEELGVDKALLDIGTDATNLVTQLCNMYLKNDLVSNEDHIKAIAAIEITQLSSAMMAVRSVEHALATLMRQLDAGGYANDTIFDQINTLSKTSMDLTVKATHYIRSLPEFLKFTAEEMKSNGLLRSVEILQETPGMQIEQTSDVDGNTTFDLSGPIMGTRALMLQIRDEETNINERIVVEEEAQKEVEAANLLEEEETVQFIDVDEDSNTESQADEDE